MISSGFAAFGNSKTACSFRVPARNPTRWGIALLPRPVVHGVLISGARHRHVPLDRPVVGVVEPLAGIGLRRGMKQTPSLKLVRLQQAAGLRDEIVDEGCRVLFDQLDRSRL